VKPKQRWWKNRGNLVIRLPGSFLACRRKADFFCILKETERKIGKSNLYKNIFGCLKWKTGSLDTCCTTYAEP